ncbi:MAG: helix-turn-helix transcriptional regulator [Clostridia bacterium]|nr:helix-turn-helix transcriptional regulator [Clostridia bacterium]
MITIKQIQDNLIDALRHSNLTQTELAEKVGVKQSQISCYLHGKKLPSLDTFANICAVLDIDPTDILDIDKYGKTI